MKTLDLHRIRHEDVDRLVENFILLNEMPVKIITGKGLAMQTLVIGVLDRHKFKYHYENFINTGALIIT